MHATSELDSQNVGTAFSEIRVYTEERVRKNTTKQKNLHISIVLDIAGNVVL